MVVWITLDPLPSTFILLKINFKSAIWLICEEKLFLVKMIIYEKIENLCFLVIYNVIMKLLWKYDYNN